ncbi:hypothetical protein D3OALGA1CA_3093 [Olavius algarvensis associated proteobacterium Delta 3]|nr:hypothetical protein D3OALGA1CA_3093 [Olavius algarvensis associated proteobacterium Delta 3]
MIRTWIGCIFIVLFTPAMALVASTVGAADWKFYGSARMTTFYIQQSEDVPTNPMFQGPGNPLNAADGDLTWALQGNSRIGATVENGSVGARFEYGASGGNANLRRLYGTWTYGKGSLLAGQDFTPITGNFSNQVVLTDAALYNIGDPFAGRLPQIKWHTGGFQLALIQPNIVPGSQISGSTYNADTDSLIPKIEAVYRHDWNGSHVRVFGGYQTYDLVNTADSSVGVGSFLFGVQGKGGFGAGGIHASIYYGQNLGTYGSVESGTLSNMNFDGGLPVFEGNSLKDNNALIAALQFDWKLTERLGFETAVGHRWMKLDTSTSREQQSYVIYAQLKVMLASTVRVVPEIGYYDFGALEQGASKQELGNAVYAGAKWQIDF